MTKSSIPNQINHNISMELLSKLSSYFKDFCHIIQTISINMEDRCINSLSQITTINTTSWAMRSSSKTYLVIDNNMHCSTNSIIFKMLHLHWFIYNSLSCKCCITMNKNRTYFITSCISHEMLLCSCSS